MQCGKPKLHLWKCPSVIVFAVSLLIKFVYWSVRREQELCVYYAWYLAWMYILIKLYCQLSDSNEMEWGLMTLRLNTIHNSVLIIFHVLQQTEWGEIRSSMIGSDEQQQIGRGTEWTSIYLVPCACTLFRGLVISTHWHVHFKVPLSCVMCIQRDHRLHRVHCVWEFGLHVCVTHLAVILGSLSC